MVTHPDPSNSKQLPPSLSLKWKDRDQGTEEEDSHPCSVERPVVVFGSLTGCVTWIEEGGTTPWRGRSQGSATSACLSSAFHPPISCQWLLLIEHKGSRRPKGTLLQSLMVSLLRLRRWTGLRRQSTSSALWKRAGAVKEEGRIKPVNPRVLVSIMLGLDTRGQTLNFLEFIVPSHPPSLPF